MSLALKNSHQCITSSSKYNIPCSRCYDCESRFLPNIFRSAPTPEPTSRLPSDYCTVQRHVLQDDVSPRSPRSVGFILHRIVSDLVVKYPEPHLLTLVHCQVDRMVGLSIRSHPHHLN